MNILNLVSLLETASTMCYIDPAATSVLLSSITAIVIAIGASAIIFWRKVKKKVSKTLHIDPNAGKEVEEDLVVNDEEIEDDEVEDDEVEEEAPKAKSKKK
jgi:MFS superfamily sulfate permease-like transporter